jgi:putative FmdB family regulatory protein
MTYEYVCTACSHAWEAEQSISEAPLKTCPNCGKDQAKRQVSGGAGFILKGGGWYADGYASAKAAGSSASGADTASASSGSAATPAASSGDTKPAAAIETKTADTSVKPSTSTTPST